MSMIASCSPYVAWKCGGPCSRQNICTTIPKNTLIVGIGHRIASNTSLHQDDRSRVRRVRIAPGPIVRERTARVKGALRCARRSA